MRLLLDEHIGLPVAEQLRKRGHDVVAAREVGLLRQANTGVLAWAVSERRAAVTADFRDYHELHDRFLDRGDRHYGIVHVPRRFSLAASGFGRLISALDALLRAHPSDDALVSAEVWLTD